MAKRAERSGIPGRGPETHLPPIATVNLALPWNGQGAVRTPAQPSRSRARIEEAPRGPLKVLEVTSLEAFRALAPVWNDVLDASETSTPFLTHEWVMSWWETFGADQDLWILVVEDESGVAAIAPFCRARRHAGPLSYRALELIGTGPLRFLGMGMSDRSDLIVARRRHECVRAIVVQLALNRGEWDIVDLRFVPEGSTTVSVLREEAAQAGLGLRLTVTAESPYLPLVGTYEEYLQSRSANFRSGLKRKLKKLEAEGDVEFHLDAGERDPVGALRDSEKVSLGSWKAEEGSALLLHRNVYTFLERLLPRLQARDQLYVAVLTLNKEPIAHELGFRFGNRVWFYDHAYRTRDAALSPGYLLTARIIERAWAEGRAEYDFLRGNENYKRGWQTQVRRELQIVLDSGSPRALAARTAYQVKWQLKQSAIAVVLQGRLAALLNRLTSGR